VSGFDPHHIEISRDEVAGNDGRGRIFLLPGSDARARVIAERFDAMVVHPSPRQLNVYLGQLRDGDRVVDVGTVASGMGCPSVDVVVTELIMLGARRVIRVGTAGSLQPHRVRVGDLVIATAAVRDEHTSEAYAPREVPAVGHHQWISALANAATKLGFAHRTYAGVVHSKDSLYGREFGLGPRRETNRDYMRCLQDLGVLATEMETSHLFTLAFVHGRNVSPIGGRSDSPEAVKAGSLLAIIGDDSTFGRPEQAKEAETRAVDVAIEAAKELLRLEAQG